jgi:hypothetical protein
MSTLCKVLWCEQTGENSNYVSERKYYINSLGVEDVFYVSWNALASNVDVSDSSLGWLAGRQSVSGTDLNGVKFLIFSDDDVRITGDLLGLIAKMQEKKLIIATGKSTSWHFSFINRFTIWLKRDIRVLLTDLNFFIVETQFYLANSSMFTDGDFYSQWNLMLEAYNLGQPIYIANDIEVTNTRHNSNEDYNSSIKRKDVISRLRREYSIARVLLRRDRPSIKLVQFANLIMAFFK